MAYSLTSLFQKCKSMMSKQPVVLIILDGWGYREEKNHNAIAHSHLEPWQTWWKTKPHALLQASGLAVGLPENQMGNSEVGHMHIGAGRILMQELTRINQDIAHGEFMKNSCFLNTLTKLKKQEKKLHIMGLLSGGGVHSHEAHLFAFLKLCYQQQFSDIILHLFLDGRDTPPQSAMQSIKRLEAILKDYPVAQIGSMTGRYYAMDRDHRWARVEPVYRLITEATSEHTATSCEEALNTYYKNGIYDEFVPPTHIQNTPALTEGDGLFFFNFRADRARQLTEAFISNEFQGFERQYRPRLGAFITMTHYADHLKTEVAYPPMSLKHTLGEVVSAEGLHQLRIAETEKYAHVTFFLNGGQEHIFPHEDRILIPSPQVKTYDEKPEMSAVELTDRLVEAIENNTYDLIVCNYANADMVGHTGNFDAAVEAIHCLNVALNRIQCAVEKVGGHLLITADHGNAECMFDESTHQPHTAHTNEPVPFLYLGHPEWHITKETGSLIDIAPTVLTLLDIKPPVEMTGQPLLKLTDTSHE
jgi:2,3-bisphosphoglycerate-independent phosphoglycerate mutase